VVRRSLPHARFIIAGEDASPRGETLLALKGLIADLNLQDHVRLLGQLEEVAPLLAALDVFVSASQTESFGLAMAEAMATSLPVVATDTVGAREVVKDGETGFVVAVGDIRALGESIMRLGNDAKLRERMGELAYQDANERFQLKRMVKAVEQIYIESLTE
jgi:glycosyltransferase involved in cell wall biosynthesis